MVMSIKNAKYAPHAGYTFRRDARFVTQRSEMKALPMMRKKAKCIEIDITPPVKVLSRQALLSIVMREFSDWIVSSSTIKAFQYLVVEKSLAFQQVPRSSITLAGILERYRLKDGKTVLLFLNEHRNVANFLIESYEEIRKYFSNNPLRLRVSQDPEDLHLKMLVLSIVAKPDEVNESYEKFADLEDEWFLNAPFEVGERLCIKLDFE
ncbi:MAG: hypothetical protein J0L70_27000 [Leptolyngbya sp. UWPOB_LEPTO1]|uniref:hypothetical protein n=1 Tax=Leptolyngbya sp. UWPOB_LEPTO1 TaxID=2815653 RepID=UPI001AC316C5|nr:hypothetical protein [Leptolyngbya sp. UWPOB_LEPTO1]MBN8564186.1 hypothetical protein [Leptolyngbya sp. UWPOB_LEPTO1]